MKAFAYLLMATLLGASLALNTVLYDMAVERADTAIAWQQEAMQARADANEAMDAMIVLMELAEARKGVGL